MLNPIKPSKHLSFDPLIKVIRDAAETLPDQRGDSDYSIADGVMSAIAMFSLKDPSLLAFQERRNDQNMKNIYRIQNVPSDTTVREMLDPIESDSLRPLFQEVYRKIQRAGALTQYVFHEDCYLSTEPSISRPRRCIVHPACNGKTIPLAKSRTTIRCSEPYSYIPIKSKSFRSHQSRSSSKTETTRTTASETPPSDFLPKSARNIRT